MIFGTVSKCMMTIKADNNLSKCKTNLAVKVKISVLILSAFLTNFIPTYI